MPAKVPNIAPVDIPMVKPIIAPYFTLSKQVGPRGRLPDIGIAGDIVANLCRYLEYVQEFAKNNSSRLVP